MDTDDELTAAVLARIEDLGGAREAEERTLIARLLGNFTFTAPEAVARIELAAAAGELREVEQAAHALKGAAGNVGAQHLADRCAQVERGARAGEPPLPAELALLRTELDVALPVLRRIAAELTGTA